MGQTVSLGWTEKTICGRLVRYTAQVVVKVVLEHEDVSMVSIPDNCWEQVKELTSLYSQAILLGHSDFARNTLASQLGRDS